ncbi:MAG: asparaginase [Vampirovibrionales bacterium]|nr:asparaginase [Vampirovibrionales bacterium]
MMEVLACRGEHVETRHRVAAIAVRHSAEVLWQTPKAADYQTYLRSSAKLWQAASGWALAALQDIPQQALAVAASSHTGSMAHQHWVLFWLNHAGLDPSALACGIHPPLDRQERHRLLKNDVPPAAVHNNCSGKHAAMLASCIAHQWPTETYLSAEHPLQRAIFNALSPQAPIDYAIDGCGLPTAWMSMKQIAMLYAQALDCPIRARILKACLTYPVLAGGQDRLDTLLMQASHGQLYAKVGADGLIGVTRLGESTCGLALKVLDGDESARAVATLTLLQSLGWLKHEAAQSVRQTLKLDKRVNWVGLDIGRWNISE